jgi:16S rRNA processing protein RimM
MSSGFKDVSSTDMEANEGWILVGRLLRARGIRGELVGEIYSSQPGRAEKLKTVRLAVGDRQRTAEVERVWNHDGRPVFKFAGIDSMTEAEAWSGADVLVSEDQRELPESGAYSHEALIGCTLIAFREDGALSGADCSEAGCSLAAEPPIGVVTGVQDFGGPTLLLVEDAGGREIMVPFAKAICREIDVEAKIIRVKLPEGLLDL